MGTCAGRLPHCSNVQHTAASAARQAGVQAACYHGMAILSTRTFTLVEPAWPSQCVYLFWRIIISTPTLLIYSYQRAALAMLRSHQCSRTAPDSGCCTPVLQRIDLDMPVISHHTRSS